MLLAVDQMRFDYLDRFGFHLSGGLARLQRGGIVFTNAWQDQAITKTEPGHAAMLSGRFPRSTGVVAHTQILEDSAYPLVAGSGPGVSPSKFRGTTLFDWMHATDPRSRALSVSRKDDAAMLMLGRARQTVLWYRGTGEFTTSRYYSDTLPTWVDAFNTSRIPHQYAGREWTPLLPEREYAEPDDVRFESLGRNTTFPHPFPLDSASTAAAFIAYPAMDSLLAAFALRGVTAMGLGAGEATDLLAMSFSTTDAVGHQFGPDSREMHDQILRLDRHIGGFLDSLFRLRDSSRVIVVLTSDHGVTSYPELVAERHGGRPMRVDLGPALDEFDVQLRRRGAGFGGSLADGIVWIDREPLRRARLNPDSVVRSLAARLRRVPNVLRVDQVNTLARRDTAKDDIARRWLHALPPDLPADLVITLKPGAYWASTINAYHGMPHADDARVPLIFYGMDIRPGVRREMVRVVDIAPTLAAILGITPAEPLDGRPLSLR
ncbi:MAG: alkaline phosphatase family protein [Gemmatimonadaceae bacterium]